MEQREWSNNIYPIITDSPFITVPQEEYVDFYLRSVPPIDSLTIAVSGLPPPSYPVLLLFNSPTIRS